MFSKVCCFYLETTVWSREREVRAWSYYPRDDHTETGLRTKLSVCSSSQVSSTCTSPVACAQRNKHVASFGLCVCVCVHVSCFLFMSRVCVLECVCVCVFMFLALYIHRFSLSICLDLETKGLRQLAGRKGRKVPIAITNVHSIPFHRIGDKRTQKANRPL